MEIDILPKAQPTHAQLFVHMRGQPADTLPPQPLDEARRDARSMGIAWAATKPRRTAIRRGDIIRLLFSDKKLAGIVVVDPIIEIDGAVDPALPKRCKNGDRR